MFGQGGEGRIGCLDRAGRKGGDKVFGQGGEGRIRCLVRAERGG